MILAEVALLLQASTYYPHRELDHSTYARGISPPRESPPGPHFKALYPLTSIVVVVGAFSATHSSPQKSTSCRNQTIFTAAAEVIHVHIPRHFTCRLVQRPKGTTIDNKETLFVKKGETNDAGAAEKAVWFSRAVDRLVTAVVVVVVV